MIALPPMIDEWFDMLYYWPPRGILVRFEMELGRGVVTRWTGTVDELQPESDAMLLRWKLTGIGREQIEARRRAGERLVTILPRRGNAVGFTTESVFRLCEWPGGFLHG